MAILPPWHMLASMSRKASGLPDISRPTSKPSFMPSSFWASAIELLADVDGQGGAHLAGQLQAVGIDVGDHDVAGAGMADHRRGHDADRPGAGDQHVLAQHVELQGRVDRVAEGIEDRLDVAGNGRVVDPDVGHRQRQVFGERAGPVDADPLGVLAQVPAAGQAVAARPQTTCPSPLTISPGWKSLTLAPTSTISAHELMADRPSARGSSSAPRRPSCRCARRCRRSPCAAPRSARR